MFNNTLALIKVLSKSLYDTSLNNNAKKKKIRGKGAFIVLIAIVLLFCAVPFFFSGLSIAQLILIEDASLIPDLWKMILPVFTIAILLLSIITIISVFFLSMENKILLPLPLKSWEILLARFVTALLLIYVIEGMLFAPIIIGVGVGSNLNYVGYLALVVILAALPILPVVIVGSIFTLLSSVINFAKYKEAFNYILIIFAILISVGLSLLTSAGSNALEGDQSSIAVILEAIRTNGNSTIQFVPTLIPAVTALTNNNIFIQLLNILLFVVINLGLVALYVILFHKSYYKVLKKFDGVHSKRVKLKSKEYQKETNTSSSFINGIMVEWKSITRSSIFFTNTILPVFLVPVIFVISFAVAMAEEGESGFSEFIALIQGNSISLMDPFVLLIVLGVFVFFASMNMTSCTAISRMGKNAQFVKYIPVSSIETINVKVFWGVFFSVIFSLILSVISVVFSILNVVDALIIFILSTSIFIFLNYLGILLDLRKPNINWDNENAAVKNNLNSLWYMLISVAIIIIIVLIGILIISLNLPFAGYIFAGIIFMLSLFGNYMFYRYYSKGSRVVFENI